MSIRANYSPQAPKRLTFAFITALLKRLTTILHACTRHMARDQWWPGPPHAWWPGCPPPSVHVQYTLPRHVLFRADARGLSVEVSLTWQHERQAPPLVERPIDQHGLEAFQERQRAQPLMLTRLLLVEVSQPLTDNPMLSEEEWQHRRCHARRCILRVGLDGLYEGWHPQDRAFWDRKELQKGLRDNDRWWFTPKKQSPLKTLRRGLARQGKTEKLADFDAVLQDTAAELQQLVPSSDVVQLLAECRGILGEGEEPRQSWGWKELWIVPGRTLPEDTLMALLLSLGQEQMLDLDRELADFVQSYLQQFRHVGDESVDWWDLFVLLRQRHSCPEHWQGLREYIAVTVRSLKKDAARKTGREAAVRAAVAGPSVIPALPKPGERWSVEEVYRYLFAEAVAAGKVPRAPRTVHNWVTRRLGIRPDPTGRLWLEARQVEQLRAWARKKWQRETQMARFIEEGEEKGNIDPQGAARKRLYRGRRGARSEPSEE